MILPMQSQNITIEDYNRAVSFRYANYNNKTAFNLHTTVNWFEDKSGFWFVDFSKERKAYKIVNFKDRKVEDLFDHERLTNALNTIQNNEVHANRLELSNFEIKAKNELLFNFKGDAYTLNLKTYQLQQDEKKSKEDENEFETKSPDGKWIAYAKNYNLFIKSIETNEEHQLSFAGRKGFEYASWYGWYDKIEGENGERPKRFYVDWSDDSKWIATSIVDFDNAEKMYMLDYSIDSLYKPKLLSYYRGSPGDTTMVHIQPVFFSIEAKKEVKTNLPKGTHINFVSPQWMKQSGMMIASYLERGFQKGFVKRIDLNSNSVQALIKEESQTNIDNFEYRVIEEQEKLVFLSERSGWRQLYSVDYKGEVNALTKGEFYVNSIAHIDEKAGVIFILASGREENNNPYHQQLYKVNLEGELTLLTPENTHHSVSFSKDGSFFVDNYSTINTPTRTVLCSADSGKIVCNLTTTDTSEAEAMGWTSPEVFNLIAKDGKTTIYGAIWKPTNFDASKSYPIIDATYTGPHTQQFPKSFNRGFQNQALAELGFIIVKIDGLGTSGRSKEFHNHSYKNMGNNLEDHVLAIKYLEKKHTWIDITRVGIYGHSAGGYDTGRAMLAFPDFYKVGVASSADHDFRMEKAWWPEMYQGWPVDESYEAVSNITNAANLKGKLLLVHGGIDNNVNPSATFKFAEALIQADKDFDLLILPSQRHGYRGKSLNYFVKKRWNYFVEHLLETEPIWDFKWE